MHENFEEKISMLLDNELNSAEAISLLERIEQDEQLKQIWDRYNKVSLTLKSNRYIHVDRHFSDRIKNDIHLSRETLPQMRPNQNKNWGYALAASIVGVSFLTWTYLQTQSLPQNAIEPIALVEPIPKSNEKLDSVHQDDALDSRLNDYLVTHNESAYSAGVQGMLPYARVVSYTRK